MKRSRRTKRDLGASQRSQSDAKTRINAAQARSQSFPRLIAPYRLFYLALPPGARLEINRSLGESAASDDLRDILRISEPYPTPVPAGKREQFLEAINVLCDRFMRDCDWLDSAMDDPELKMIAKCFRAAHQEWPPDDRYAEYIERGWGTIEGLSLDNEFHRAIALAFEIAAVEESDAPGRHALVQDILRRKADDLSGRFEFRGYLGYPLMRVLISVCASLAFGQEMTLPPLTLDPSEGDVFAARGRSELTISFPLYEFEQRKQLERRLKDLERQLLRMVPAATGPGRPREVTRGANWLYDWKVRKLTHQLIAREWSSVQATEVSEATVSKEIKKVRELLKAASPHVIHVEGASIRPSHSGHGNRPPS